MAPGLNRLHYAKHGPRPEDGSPRAIAAHENLQGESAKGDFFSSSATKEERNDENRSGKS